MKYEIWNMTWNNGFYLGEDHFQVTIGYLKETIIIFWYKAWYWMSNRSFYAYWYLPYPLSLLFSGNYGYNSILQIITILKDNMYWDV